MLLKIKNSWISNAVLAECKITPSLLETPVTALSDIYTKVMEIYAPKMTYTQTFRAA